MEFPTEAQAGSFAASFPAVDDPNAVDPAVVVDVNRSKKSVWSRRVLMLGRWYVLYLAIMESLLIAAALQLGRLGLPQVGFIAAGLALAAILYLPSHLRPFREERLDVQAKWPKVALERWAQEGTARARVFLREMRGLGLELDPEDPDVRWLDSFNRSQPPQADFRGFAREAAAYIGELAMAATSRDIPIAGGTTRGVGTSSSR